MKQAEDRQPLELWPGKKFRIPLNEKMLSGRMSCGSMANSAGEWASTAS